MKDYPNLKGMEKEVVDYTIANHLNENPIIRKRRFIGYKKIKPKQSDLWFMRWRDIIALREAVQAADIFQVINVVYSLNQNQVIKLDIFNCFAAYNWIKSEMVKIHQAEMNELFQELTAEEEDAGVERMAEFGYQVALDDLTKGNVNDEDNWLNLPYAKIFMKLAMNKRRNEIQKQHQENVSRKNKSNSSR